MIQIQLRRGTAVQWSGVNPILALGELGIETDTVRNKVGDGVTHWNDLGYGFEGPQGPIGPIGVVSGTYPIIYNSGTQSVSIDTSYFAPSGNYLISGVTTTTEIPEGSNLYYTDGRVDLRIGIVGSGLFQPIGDYLLSGTSTTDIPEGINLYYTNARADARVGIVGSGLFQPIGSYQPSGNYLISGVSNTDALLEGTGNLYFTNPRVITAISGQTIKPLVVDIEPSGYIDMDTTAANPSYQEGRVFYDNTDHTLAYYNDASDVTVNVGQEQLLRVRNNTGATLTNGKAVHINGSLGNRPTVHYSIADSLEHQMVVGLVTHDINDGDDGYITQMGIIHNVKADDIGVSGVSAGSKLYLSTTVSGNMTTTRPISPYFVVPIGYVSRVAGQNIDIVVEQDGPANIGWDGANSVLGINASGNGPEYKSIYGTDPVDVTHATGSITISMPVATSTADGYLSQSDWSIFNGKQPAGNYLVSGTTTTSIIPEGSNLYYTNTRVANSPAISGATTAIAGKQPFQGVQGRIAGTITPLPPFLTGSTFTLSGSTTPLVYWVNGVQGTINTNVSCTVPSGLSVIKISGLSNTIYATTAGPSFNIGDDVYIAVVLYNGSDYGVVYDERHGYDRNLPWHEWAHDTIGVRYENGLTMTNNAPAVGGAATFAYTAGSIHDEDLDISIASGTQARIFFQTSATTIGFDKALSTMPFASGTSGRPQYINTSTWARTTMTSAVNRYINVFLYATNSCLNQIWSLIEPVSAATAAANGYTSLANARAVPFPNLANYAIGPEYKPLYRMIVRADGQLQAIDTVQDDYRNATSIPMAGGSASTSANIVSFNPYGIATSTNVQNAIQDVIDNTIQSGTNANTSGVSIFNSKSGNNLVFNTISGIGVGVTSANGIISISGSSATFSGGDITSSLTPSSSGTLSIGTAAKPFSGTYSNVYGTTYVSISGVSGVNTINWNNGAVQNIDFTGVASGTCTISGTNGVAGSAYMLTTKQNAGGTITLAWGSEHIWQGGISGVATAAGAKIDMFNFMYNGTKFLGSYSNNYF